MKIGYLVNHLDHHGGIEKVVSQKINAWITIYGFDVVLITKLKEQEHFVYEVHPKCTTYNLNIKSFPNKQYIKNVKKYLSLYIQVKDIINQEKIDVLFTTLTSIDSLIIPFIKKKIPKVLEFHHSGIYLQAKSWKYKKKIVAKYNAVAVLNKDEVAYYQLPNIIVIPNFICREHASNQIKKDKVIISAGRIDKIKQFDHMIEVWANLTGQFPEWQFHLYGNGISEEYSRLVTLIKNSNLTETFKIFAATDDLHSKMLTSSVFVQTSASECFSMVILEAMNAGLPVISYDSPNGPRNIISDGIDGIIVPLNDKSQLAQKLGLLLSNEQERFALVHNQDSKLLKFSKKNIMDKWLNLISSFNKK